MSIHKKTVGQLWIEEKKRLQALRDAGEVSPRISSKIKSIIESKIGRKLTPREEIHGRLERIDERLIPEKIAANNWKPVLKKSDQPESSFDSEIEKAEQKAWEEHVYSLPPEQRRLEFLKRAREDELKRLAKENNHETKLANPKIANALERLRGLLDKVAFDPEWSFADIEAIEQAIKQLETPNADEEVGLQMAHNVVQISKQKRSAALAEIQRQELELKEQSAALAAEKFSLDDESPEITNVDPILAELNSKQSELVKIWEDDPSPENRRAALDAIDAYDAYVAENNESSGDVAE